MYDIDDEIGYEADPPMPDRPVAVVAGATGLVGRALVRRLAADGTWREIRALVRRPLLRDLALPTVVPVQVDYTAIATDPLWAEDADHFFCALGTTMRQAGSREAFRKVDLTYPMAFALIGLAYGVRHFLLVSALGANPSSPIFYNRTKGELERELREMGFPSLTIARPSLLLGERTERRAGERIGKVLGRLAPERWRPVAATSVADALVAAAKYDLPGTYVLENHELRRAGTDAG